MAKKTSSKSGTRKKTTRKKTPAKAEAKNTKKAEAEKKTKTVAGKKTKTTAQKKKTASSAATSTKKTKKQAPKTAKKKTAVSIKTILMKNFDTGEVPITPVPAPKSDQDAVYTAPPAIEAADNAQASQLKALLLKKIDFNTPVEPIQASENETEDQGAETEDKTKETEAGTDSLQEKSQPETPAETDSKKQSEEKTVEKEETKPEEEKNGAIETQAETETGPETKSAAGSEKMPESSSEEKLLEKTEKEPEIEQVEKPEKETADKPGPRVESESEALPDMEKKPASPAETGQQTAGSKKTPSLILSTWHEIPGPLKGIIVCLAVIIALIVTASAINSGHYYLEQKKTGLAVLKGDFSPAGKKQIAFLPLTQAPEHIKDVYTKSEVFNLIYKYYMNKADELSGSNVLTNLESAKACIHRAMHYAQSLAAIDSAAKRLEEIDSKLKGLTQLPGKK